MAVELTKEMRELLDSITIDHGSHNPDDRTSKLLCIMEATAYVAGEPHSDYPICVSDTITAFLIGVNDSRKTMASDPATELEKLKVVIPEIMGTCPTKVVEGEHWDHTQGQVVVGKYETSDSFNAAYHKAEKARATYLLNEMQRLGYLPKIWDEIAEEGKTYGEDPSELVLENIVYNQVPTDEAIRVAREMVKITG